ncbi:hypothetical protein [Nitratifractor sp.]
MAVERRESAVKLEYDEDILNLGIVLYEKAMIPLEIIYNLLKERRIYGFSVILVRGQEKGCGEFIRKKKRKTDYLVTIDEDRNIHCLLCQETKVDGGYHFIKRLNRELEQADKIAAIQAGILAIEGGHYSVKNLLLLALDTFVKILNSEERIVFRTLR